MNNKTIFFCIIWFNAALTFNIIAVVPMTLIERSKVENIIFPYEGDEFVTYLLPILVGSLFGLLICKYIFGIE